MEAGKVTIEGLDDIMAYKEFLKRTSTDFGQTDIKGIEKPTNEIIEQQLETAGVNQEELKEVLENDNADPKTIDKVYNAVLNTKLTDEQIDLISSTMKEEADKNPDIQAMKDISKKIESGELSTEGEYVNATVSIDPASGEKQVIAVDEEKGSDISIDELISKDVMEINDEAIEKTIHENFAALTDEESISLITAIKHFQRGDIGLTEVFSMFPNKIQALFNNEASKAGLNGGNIKSYRNAFVKQFLSDILDQAQNEQLSVDFDRQLTDIYKEYGNNVSLIIQANLYEKINSMEKKLEDVKAKDYENPEEKVNKVELYEKIIKNLYESYEFNNFAIYFAKTKIKPFEMEKPKKLYDDFKAKYKDSKFMIQDVENIIAPLINYVGFTENEAKVFAILFCKYCKNMKADNLDEHIFMYYVINNIISLAMKGGVVEGEDSSDNHFLTVLINNIKKLMEIRYNKLNNPGSEIIYKAEKIDKDYMNHIIELANEKAAEIEEEAKKLEEEEVTENTDEDKENSSVEDNNTQE